MLSLSLQQCFFMKVLIGNLSFAYLIACLSSRLVIALFQVDENFYHAHRIVLASTIPYFHAMFTHDMVLIKRNKNSIRRVKALCFKLSSVLPTSF